MNEPGSLQVGQGVQRLKRLTHFIGWSLIPILAIANSGAAQANTPVFAAVLRPPTAVIVLASTSSRCISISYDKNGNRVSQTVASVTTSATIWGSGNYGCFVWKS